MKIFVKVKARSRTDAVEKLDDTHFVVLVKAPPIQGKANAQVIAQVAGYFKVSTSRIKIISGTRARLKTIEIL